MRFLVAHPGPHFSVHDLYAGWVEALRACGQDVFEFNLHDRLTFYANALFETEEEGKFKRALTPEQATELAVNGLYASVLKVRPHVLFVVSGFFVPAHLMDVARVAGVTVVLVCTESPYQDDQQVALAAHANLTIVNDPMNIEQFRQVGAAEYFPHAYRPVIHHPGAAIPDLASDLAFVGTGYPSRIEFFEQMDLDGLDVLLAGNWRLLAADSPLRASVAHRVDDCLDNGDAAGVYRSMRAGINLYRREASAEHLAEGWAMGPREVEMAACGGFFLRDRRPEGDDLLPMLPTFTSAGDAAEQLRWWLRHDSQRETAAQKALDAIQDRTFDNHAARLLRLLDKE